MTATIHQFPTPADMTESQAKRRAIDMICRMDRTSTAALLAVLKADHPDLYERIQDINGKAGR